jgi:hypothetical protein
MTNDSDDVPTRIIKRETRPRPTATAASSAGRDEQMTRPVGRQVDLDSEQVVTRRISSPLKRIATDEPAPQPAKGATASTPVEEVSLPAGWVTVVKGPGRGRFLPVFIGMNSLGRDPTNRLPINFGDEMISRADHAFIVYDDEQRAFWVQHGGKSNLVRLDGSPVLAPTALLNGSIIRVGATELRFTAFCDDAFDWTASP